MKQRPLATRLRAARILLLVLLAGCGMREEGPEAVETSLSVRTCEWSRGRRICIIKFKDGTTCVTEGGNLQCRDGNSTP